MDVVVVVVVLFFNNLKYGYSYNEYWKHIVIVHVNISSSKFLANTNLKFAENNMILKCGLCGNVL